MTVTLPHLTALVDSQANVVSGEAPPGARLMVSLYGHYYPTEYWPITATIAGTYSVDLGDGATNGTVAYLHPDGHRVTLDFSVPHIRITLGSPRVYGAPPGPGVLTATLRSADGEFKGSGVDTYGDPHYFSVYLTDAQQEPVMVSGGDVLFIEAAGGVMSVTVPVLTASFDQRTGILTGIAPAGAWLRVHVEYYFYFRQVQARPDGTYAMDWSDLSLPLGTWGGVETTDDRGNETSLIFAVPYYGVYLPLITRGL